MDVYILVQVYNRYNVEQLKKNLTAKYVVYHLMQQKTSGHLLVCLSVCMCLLVGMLVTYLVNCWMVFDETQKIIIYYALINNWSLSKITVTANQKRYEFCIIVLSPTDHTRFSLKLWQWLLESTLSLCLLGSFLISQWTDIFETLKKYYLNAHVQLNKLSLSDK